MLLSEYKKGQIFSLKGISSHEPLWDYYKEYKSGSSWPVKGIRDTYREDRDVEPLQFTVNDTFYHISRAFYEPVSSKVIAEVFINGGVIVHTIEFQLNPSDSLNAFCGKVASCLEDTILKIQREKEMSKLGSTYKPSTVIIEEAKQVVINIDKSAPITDRFTTIIGSLSTIVDNINEKTSLGSQKELADAFVKAKLELSKATEVSTNFVTQYLEDTKWYQKIKSKAITTKARSDSVKKNIDILFGLMHEKYNTLISVAESLQESLATLQAQVQALKELEQESDEYLSQYKEDEIPTRELAMNTQIKASVLKYQDRIAKVKGSIIAMQATIVALGRDLPAHKADLEDEMAISGLLSNVDDYQQMFTQIKDLVTTVTDSTRAKTYQVVDNLMKMQINDTNTMKALQANIDSGSKFAKMLSTHADTLATKAINDAKQIKTLATQHLKQLKE